MLFVNKGECEEVGFRYSKSAKILLHSFCFGDDFNFVVVTNNVITLYNINLADHTPKVIEKIAITQVDSITACYFEPMANCLVLLDPYGSAHVYYLNLHNENAKSNFRKMENSFRLEIAFRAEDLSGYSAEHEKSLLEKMQSYFQHKIDEGQFLIRDHLAFKNLRTHEEKQHVVEWTEQGKVSQEIDEEQKEHYRRQEHQFLIGVIQDRVMFLHSNPYVGKIFMFELNPESLVTRKGN